MSLENGVCPWVCTKLFYLCLTLCHPMDWARQAPLSMGFSRQEYWSGFHALLQGVSQVTAATCVSFVSCIEGRFFTTEPSGKPLYFSISALCKPRYWRSNIYWTGSWSTRIAYSSSYPTFCWSLRGYAKAWFWIPLIYMGLDAQPWTNPLAGRFID